MIPMSHDAFYRAPLTKDLPSLPTFFGAPMFNMGCEICEMPLKKNINTAQNFDSMTLMKNF